MKKNCVMFAIRVFNKTSLLGILIFFTCIPKIIVDLVIFDTPYCVQTGIECKHRLSKLIQHWEKFLKEEFHDQWHITARSWRSNSFIGKTPLGFVGSLSSNLAVKKLIFELEIQFVFFKLQLVSPPIQTQTGYSNSIHPNLPSNLQPAEIPGTNQMHPSKTSPHLKYWNKKGRKKTRRRRKRSKASNEQAPPHDPDNLPPRNFCNLKSPKFETWNPKMEIITTFQFNMKCMNKKPRRALIFKGINFNSSRPCGGKLDFNSQSWGTHFQYLSNPSLFLVYHLFLILLCSFLPPSLHLLFPLSITFWLLKRNVLFSFQPPKSSSNGGKLKYQRLWIYSKINLGKRRTKNTYLIVFIPIFLFDIINSHDYFQSYSKWSQINMTMKWLLKKRSCGRRSFQNKKYFITEYGVLLMRFKLQKKLAQLSAVDSFSWRKVGVTPEAFNCWQLSDFSFCSAKFQKEDLICNLMELFNLIEESEISGEEFYTTFMAFYIHTSAKLISLVIHTILLCLALTSVTFSQIISFQLNLYPCLYSLGLENWGSYFLVPLFKKFPSTSGCNCFFFYFTFPLLDSNPLSIFPQSEVGQSVTTPTPELPAALMLV
ncbi:hypothetical protein VP01_1878g1 [Puccinia sorghi]|uniref:Uncharacterized protein n=1 Tax=Puccinia sorghi TaxID=27349 RepID=A0A0L6VEZ0_9BASI|nr:hypothetical protein VP01_1878g1 [Puccinia sorghi]